MTKSLKSIMETLPEARRRKIELRTAKLMEEMSLSDLRKAVEVTQENLAQKLSIGQEGVSRLEKRTDLLLSSLEGYLEGLGATLELVAHFPNRPPVSIKGLSLLNAGLAPTRRRLRNKKQAVGKRRTVA